MICFVLAVLARADDQDPYTFKEGMMKIDGSLSLAWAKFAKFMEDHLGPVWRILRRIGKTISLIFNTLIDSIKETVKILRCLFANIFKGNRSVPANTDKPVVVNTVNNAGTSNDINIGNTEKDQVVNDGGNDSEL